MTGRDLAIYQAAESFELFTGLAPSTAEMKKAFDRVMSEARAGQRGDPHLMELSIKGEFSAFITRPCRWRPIPARLVPSLLTTLFDMQSLANAC